MSADVVVLDHHGIVEAHSVVVTASAAHSVLLEVAHEGDSFAGVNDLGPGGFDGFDEAVCEGADAAEHHQVVQSGSLNLEGMVAFEGAFSDDGARGNLGSVGHKTFGFLAEQVGNDSDPADDASGLGFDVPIDESTRGNGGGSDVTGVDILGKCGSDVVFPTKWLRFLPHISHPWC